MRILLVILILILVGAIVLIKLLPLKFSIPLLIVGFFAGIWFLKWLVRSLFMAPFKAKSAVLKGATAQVHGVTFAAMPDLAWSGDEDEEEEEEDEDDDEMDSYRQEQEADFKKRRWYHVDVTITPQPSKGAFQHWEAGELMLVRPETDTRKMDEDTEIDSDGDADPGPLCVLHDLEVWDGSAFGPDEPGKYQGEQRLRLLVGARPGQERFKFQYYFEGFGEVILPQS